MTYRNEPLHTVTTALILVITAIAVAGPAAGFGGFRRRDARY
ncbi:hypothetical protein AB4305_22210 [Nocardia sp. 2YAB30]